MIFPLFLLNIKVEFLLVFSGANVLHSSENIVSTFTEDKASTCVHPCFIGRMLSRSLASSQITQVPGEPLRTKFMLPPKVSNSPICDQDCNFDSPAPVPFTRHICQKRHQSISYICCLGRINWEVPINLPQMHPKVKEVNFN